MNTSTTESTITAESRRSMRSHHARRMARKAIAWISKHSNYLDGQHMLRDFFGRVYQVTEEAPQMPAVWSTFSWVSTSLAPVECREVTFHMHGTPSAEDVEALAFEAVAAVAVSVLRERYGMPIGPCGVLRIAHEGAVMELVVARLRANVAAARAVVQ